MNAAEATTAGKTARTRGSSAREAGGARRGAASTREAREARERGRRSRRGGDDARGATATRRRDARAGRGGRRAGGGARRDEDARETRAKKRAGERAGERAEARASSPSPPRVGRDGAKCRRRPRRGDASRRDARAQSESPENSLDFASTRRKTVYLCRLRIPTLAPRVIVMRRYSYENYKYTVVCWSVAEARPLRTLVRRSRTGAAAASSLASPPPSSARNARSESSRPRARARARGDDLRRTRSSAIRRAFEHEDNYRRRAPPPRGEERVVGDRPGRGPGVRASARGSGGPARVVDASARSSSRRRARRTRGVGRARPATSRAPPRADPVRGTKPLPSDLPPARLVICGFNWLEDGRGGFRRGIGTS